MKQDSSFRIVAMACLWLGVSTMPIRVAAAEQQPQRTLLPWLILLNYRPLGVGATLPGIPIRRPNDVPTRIPNDVPTRRPNDMPTATLSPTQSANQVASTAQNDANLNASDLIREQFIQGLVQGIQSMPANRGPTIRPEVLADLLQQINAAQSNQSTTSKPSSIEKELQSSNANTEADYDYIDFKNGQRIKYELDDDQQQSHAFIYHRPQAYFI